MADSDHSGTVPLDSEEIRDLPGAIRDAKNQIAYRANLEHSTVASGSDDDDRGGIHEKGSARSYFQAGHAESARPGGTALKTDGGDDGRVLVDTDDSSLWVWDDAWIEVKVVGGFGGAELVILDGRAGGQTLSGGTAATDDLTLQGTSHAVPSGDHEIIVTAAKTSAWDFNSVPVKDLVLGADASGASTDGSDGYKIAGVKDASASHDVLTLAAAVITASELSTTGGVARCAFGSAAGSAAATKTIDLGFAPDLIIAWNTHVSIAGVLWTANDASNNKCMSGAYITTSVPVTVSTNTVSFLHNNNYVNQNGYSFFYIALKFNASSGTPA